MTSANTAIVTVRLSGNLKTKLEALARTTKRSKSYLAAEAIAAYVALNEWQIAEIEAGVAELDSGHVVSEEEAEERYDRLLKPR
jgi:RHH-type rel operon transcriptional repressor/antitoxin RelB